MRRRASACALLPLLLAGLAGGLRAQDPADPAPPPKASVAPVPSELASPRATMRTFLLGHEAAARGDRQGLVRATRCLDLSQVNETLRAKKGEELALQLKQVIDKVRYVIYAQLPDQTEGEPYVFHRDEHGRGDILISRQPDGRWLFDAGTLAALPELVRALEDRQSVAGATEAAIDLSPSLWLREHMPRSLRATGFLLEHWQWLGILTLVVVGLILDKLLVALLAALSRLWLRRREVTIEWDVLTRGARPFGLLAMALLWRLGDVLLALPVQAHNILVVAVNVLVAGSGVWGAYRLVDVAAEALAQRAARTTTKMDDLLVPLLRKTAKVFVAVMGLVFVAETMELSIGSLLAGLGLGGLAFALAAQDTVKNLFGSLTVVIDRPFQVGDWIVVDGGVEGTVEEVGFRSTRIRTFYDSLITLPNSLLLTVKVDNLGMRRYRRWKTMVSIAYDTPPDTIEAFCEGIRELVRRHPYTRKDYFQVWLNAFSGSSLDVLLYVFHEVPDWSTELRERQRLFLDILRLARDMRVQFAFPTQTVHLHRAPESETMPPLAPPPVTPSLVPTEAAQERGRAYARALLLGGTEAPAGQRPPTVRLQVSPQEDRGDGGE